MRAAHADPDLQLIERLAPGAVPATAPQVTVTLTFDARQRSRLHVRLDDGRAAALLLPRGTRLRGGDVLRAGDGTLVGVRAAAEPVSTARSSDALLLARACYHLGNRHVALEIGAHHLRYLHDHVLDAMLAALGLAVVSESVPFEPEPGAFGGGHGHSHHGH